MASKVWIWLIITGSALQSTMLSASQPTLWDTGHSPARCKCAGAQALVKSNAARLLRIRGGGFFAGSVDFELSVEERSQLAELRDSLGHDLTLAVERNPDFATDDRLVRLLRANQNDVARTVRFWATMQECRASFDCDNIRSEVEKHYSESFWDMKCLPMRDTIRAFYHFEPNHAVTSDGDLVSAECTGKIKVRSFMKEVPERDLMRFWCYMMEWTMMKLATLSRKHRRIASMVQVKDLQGLPLAQATCPLAIARFAKINIFVHQVYPETLRQIVVINIPSMFAVIWRLFQPLLPARTLRRISITSHASRAQQQILEAYLSSSDRLVLNQGAACYVPSCEALCSSSSESATRRHHGTGDELQVGAHSVTFAKNSRPLVQAAVVEGR